MTRLPGRSLLLGTLTLTMLTLQEAAVAAPAARLVLRPSYGGAVLQGKLYLPGNDVITGIWSGAGFSRLLKCAPRCTVVSSIPVQNTLYLSSSSAYRVALGGSFREGQKVSLTVRLRDQRLFVTQAVVSPP